MLRFAPTLLVLLPGCGFHRPAWDAVTAPAVSDSRPRPPLLAATDGEADPDKACALPTTTYHVVAHGDAKRQEWLLQLRLAAGDELAGPGEGDEIGSEYEGEEFLVRRTVTPLDASAPRADRTRLGSTWWLPMFGQDAWAMAVELEQLRSHADGATATATLLAQARRPIGGAIAIVNLAMALTNDREIEAALLKTGREPSTFDLVRAQLLLATRGDAAAYEFITLQPLASEAVVVDEGHGPGIRRRMAVDVTVGSTHVVRIVLDTVPVAGPLDLSQGITRVVIQHPGDPGRFVLVEQVDGERADG